MERVVSAGTEEELDRKIKELKEEGWSVKEVVSDGLVDTNVIAILTK